MTRHQLVKAVQRTGYRAHAEAVRLSRRSPYGAVVTVTDSDQRYIDAALEHSAAKLALAKYDKQVSK